MNSVDKLRLRVAVVEAAVAFLEADEACAQWKGTPESAKYLHAFGDRSDALLAAARAYRDQESKAEADYRARAIPRLAAIDALDRHCKWNEMAPGPEAEKARERWHRLMAQQRQDEAESGL